MTRRNKYNKTKMLNEERLEKVSTEEQNEWKIGYTHGDFERMAHFYGSHASKYRRAQKTGYVTPTTRKEMNEFYAAKKELQS